MTTRRAGASAAPARAAPRAGGALRLPAHAVLRGRGFLGRHLSVRWKLTLWYAVIYTLTVALIGFSLPRLLQIETDARIDSDLRRTAQIMLTNPAFSQVVAGPSVRPNQSQLPPDCQRVKAIQVYCYRIETTLTEYSRRLSAPGQVEQVVLFTPTVPAILVQPNNQSTGVNGVDQMLFLSEVASRRQPQYTRIPAGGEEVRVYAVPLSPPPSLQGKVGGGVLEVFQPETTYVQIQSALYLILLLESPILLVLGLLVGWVIARAALRPIGRISRTVRSIGEARDLIRRLNFVGPRDEVGRLAETFDGMMDRLENAFETQKRFIADASHELRTPLTAIRGNADLMRIAPPEERDVCLAAIRRESERMSRLVADLLLLAEADISEHPLHTQPVDLSQVLEDVYRSALVIAQDKVEVLIDRCNPVVIDADPDRIKQLLLNLVDNAVKFTPRGGTVMLSVHAEQGGARLEVADSGIGIAPEEQDAIFRRFYRVERSRSTRGSGLGLSIVSWIVESHGGTIDLRSRPGQGTTFVVHLPARSGGSTNGAARSTGHGERIAAAEGKGT